MTTEPLLPSTPQASAAVTQSRGEGDAASSIPEVEAPCPGKGYLFDIGPRVYRAAHTRPYERQLPVDPLYRPLKIYSLDPSVSRRDGAVALVNVPYEPLQVGPKGALFEVDDVDAYHEVRYRSANLDDPGILIRNGRDPSPSDPLFHQQMVYAVCSLVYAAFKSALGRNVAWGFDWPHDHEGAARLLIRPHAGYESNAYYDKDQGTLSFGYYKAEDEVSGTNLPGGYFFTCLSHDVIAHEVTHALLDGLRAHFVYPSGPDVLAFHEAFADLVAIFQHFSYKEVLLTEIRKTRGELNHADLLTGLARQFGETTGARGALRTVVGQDSSYGDVGDEPHERGSVLASAVFEAFTTIFRRKTQRYLRLATNGSGILPPGEPPVDLQQLLAKEASELASQFLAMCIRAVDYCPPVDLEFGEFLRAAITADYDLVPDDPWGYREAWINAFQRRGIYPRHVSSLSEDALLWRPPQRKLANVERLSFSCLAFDGDPGSPASESELRRQACELGTFVSQRENLDLFGLAHPDEPRLGGDVVEPPAIESIRSSRRAGPDGQVVFDLVAEVTQRRIVSGTNGHDAFDFYGGATIILGPRGEFRYVISKNVLNERRLQNQRAFIFGDRSRQFWRSEDGKRKPQPQLFKLMHDFHADRSPDAFRVGMDLDDDEARYA